jgi:serine/threonine protein kinase
MQKFQILSQLGSISLGSVLTTKSINTGQISCAKKIKFHYDDKELKEIQKKYHVWSDLDHPKITNFGKEESFYLLKMKHDILLDNYFQILNFVMITKFFIKILNLKIFFLQTPINSIYLIMEFRDQLIIT